MSGPQPVQFTRQSAERIAAVVRQQELTPAPASPLEFQAFVPGGRSGGNVRVGTFSGAWNKGATKTVSLANAATTKVAINLFATVGAFAGDRSCAIAKDGTAWYLIAAECV